MLKRANHSEPFQAYQFTGDRPAFEHRFKYFIVANSSRRALLNRLSDLVAFGIQGLMSTL